LHVKTYLSVPWWFNDQLISDVDTGESCGNGNNPGGGDGDGNADSKPWDTDGGPGDGTGTGPWNRDD